MTAACDAVNLNGPKIEILVETSLGDKRPPGPDQRKWCLGIAVDTDSGKFYWAQKSSEVGYVSFGDIFFQRRVQ